MRHVLDCACVSVWVFVFSTYRNRSYYSLLVSCYPSIRRSYIPWHVFNSQNSEHSSLTSNTKAACDPHIVPRAREHDRELHMRSYIYIYIYIYILCYIINFVQTEQQIGITRENSLNMHTCYHLFISLFFSDFLLLYSNKFEYIHNI